MAVFSITNQISFSAVINLLLTFKSSVQAITMRHPVVFYTVGLHNGNSGKKRGATTSTFAFGLDFSKLNFSNPFLHLQSRH
jgi:hypothetical protein